MGFAGGDATPALAEFAEANHLPVVATFRRNDVIDNHSTSYVGDAGVGMMRHVERLIAEADLILAVDVRFDEMMTKAYTLFDMPDAVQHIVHVHPSDRELGKVVHADVPIQATGEQFWTAIAGAELNVPEGLSLIHI